MFCRPKAKISPIRVAMKRRTSAPKECAESPPREAVLTEDRILQQHPNAPKRPRPTDRYREDAVIVDDILMPESLDEDDSGEVDSDMPSPRAQWILPRRLFTPPASAKKEECSERKTEVELAKQFRPIQIDDEKPPKDEGGHDKSQEDMYTKQRAASERQSSAKRSG